MDAFLFAYVDKKLVYKGPDRIDYLHFRSLGKYPNGTVFEERYFIPDGDGWSFCGQLVRKIGKLDYRVNTDSIVSKRITRSATGKLRKEERNALLGEQA